MPIEWMRGLEPPDHHPRLASHSGGLLRRADLDPFPDALF